MQGNQTRSAGTNNQQPQGQPGATPYTAPPAQPQQAPVGGLRSGLKRNTSPISANGGDKSMVELLKKLQDRFDADPTPELKACQFSLIPIPRNAGFANAISVITVVLGVGDRFAYHSLLLAGDANPFRETTERFDSMPQPVVRTPADYADDALLNIIRNKVSVLYPQNVTTSGDWEIVPADFNVTDDRLVDMLFSNAIRACWFEIIPKQPNFQYIDLASLASDNSGVVRTSFNQDQTTPRQDTIDATGLPVRNEIIIDFRTEQKNQPSKELQTENSTQNEDLGRMGGFVNISIDPVAQRANPYGGAPQMRNPNETQEYVAEFVITTVDMAMDVDLSSMLLMLSTTFPLLDSNSQPWKRNFMPKHLQAAGYTNERASGRFNPRDIGALNYDYGLKDADGVVQRIDTTDIQKFGVDDFYRTMYMMVRESLALSMDVPEVGAETWMLRPFAEASSVPEAFAAIVKAADGLTGGRFSPIFFREGSSKLITLPREERILNGYYLAEDGTKQDVRNVDMLFLLNKEGHQDGAIARRFASTFGGNNTNIQLMQRAKLNEIVGHVVYTGASRRKTFHPDFLSALDQAITQTGLKVRNEIGMGDARSNMRPMAGLAQAGALNTNFTSGMYNYGVTGGPSGGFRPMSHSRQY